MAHVTKKSAKVKHLIWFKWNQNNYVVLRPWIAQNRLHIYKGLTEQRHWGSRNTDTTLQPYSFQAFRVPKLINMILNVYGAEHFNGSCIRLDLLYQQTHTHTHLPANHNHFKHHFLSFVDNINLKKLCRVCLWTVWSHHKIIAQNDG